MVSDLERQALREVHEYTNLSIDPDLNPGEWCMGCEDPWPCPTIKLLDTLDELEAKLPLFAKLNEQSFLDMLAENTALSMMLNNVNDFGVKQDKELEAARRVVEAARYYSADSYGDYELRTALDAYDKVVGQ